MASDDAQVREVAPSPHAVPEVRRWALAQVASWPGPEQERLETVVAELVANAVEHGEPPITVTLQRSGRRVRLTVADAGRGPSEPASRRVPGALRERGRGLEVVRALADELRCEVGDGYRVVAELTDRGPQAQA